MEQWAGHRAVGRSFQTKGVAGSRPPSPGSAYRWASDERYKGIGRGHTSDQGSDRGVDRRTSCGARPERGPVAAKATSLPAQHGGRSHDDEALPPSGPHCGQPDPKKPIAPFKVRSVRHPVPVTNLIRAAEPTALDHSSVNVLIEPVHQSRRGIGCVKRADGRRRDTGP
jgi:hypothetical protein